MGIVSMGNVLFPRDKVPILGTGSSSLRVAATAAAPIGPRCVPPIPLPLRGRVWVQPELRPYPSGAESLRARSPFFAAPPATSEDPASVAPVRCRLEPRREGSSANSIGPGEGGSGVESAVSYRAEETP